MKLERIFVGGLGLALAVGAGFVAGGQVTDHRDWTRLGVTICISAAVASCLPLVLAGCYLLVERLRGR